MLLAKETSCPPAIDEALPSYQIAADDSSTSLSACPPAYQASDKDAKAKSIRFMQRVRKLFAVSDATKGQHAVWGANVADEGRSRLWGGGH